jgi:hypothetical protein
MKVASGTSRCALPSGIPRRTPSARALGSASMTDPGLQGRPPSTSGPRSWKGSERRASARWRGRCGRNRCNRRIVDLAIGGLVYGGWSDPGRGLVHQQGVRVRHVSRSPPSA